MSLSKTKSRSSCDGTFDEESPLLDYSRPTTVGAHSLIHQTHSSRIIVLLLTTIVFIIGFGTYLVWIPSMRIYEDILCHRYYEELQGQSGVGLSSTIDEARCKGDKVQEELNILTAVLETLKALPGMFMAVPYGLLADKIGRKPVFALSILGLLLSLLFEVFIMSEWMMLPIRAVWFAPFLQFIGGGEKTASAIFYAIISDVTTQDERANAFLFAACASLSAELIAPTVAAAIMVYSPWISICCGVFVLTSGLLCLITFVPETLHLHTSQTTSSTLIPDDSSSEYISDSSSDFNEPLKPKRKLTITRRLSDFYTTSRPLLTLPVLLLLLPSMTRVIGQQSIELCIRYISTRFSIPLSHASLILSLRALINILLLLLLIPFLSSFLITKFHFSSTHKDLLLARISSIFLILGALTIAISPSLRLTIIGLIIYTLGTGLVSLVRSLITGLVDQKHVARIFALIAVVETSSSLLAGPAVAGLYELGLIWRGEWTGWLGLPFVGLALVCGVGSVGVWGVKGLGKMSLERKREVEVGEVGSENERV
ncbi:putative mfs multidrug protein [Botrytis fragariae]|uniref:Putative mfs multidrug protein n=1 Tax=Botrytis fragariae TaxID=1964551 RepID=A0A8H6B0M9_9HELO|nr:putative mfs multidrug protein [Botrytis fragariae]KAF5876927.1 putative mfs multidrug protein [Botrytis fragariae]